MRGVPVLILAIVMAAQPAFCQKKKNTGLPFGEIAAKDFSPQVYTIDSTAQAVILYDGGSAVYKSDKESWFNVVYTYHKRIRILNKNAFDLATVEIPLFKGEKKEDRIEKLEAATYNIENGVIRKTKLDKESLFDDKASKEVSVKKFTLPDLKEGCIIEYKYTVISPTTYNLRGWTFQDRYPVLQSEYEITAPTLFNFVFLNTGYYDLQPASVDEGFEVYNIVYRSSTAMGSSDMYAYNATTLHSRWSLTNLPAMVKESYTTTLKNHAARIEFQLRSLNFPNSVPKYIMDTWQEFGAELLKDETFGASLFDKNGWLSDDVKRLTVPGDMQATARNIYNFVRDNFTLTDDEAVYMEGPLRKAFAAKKGNVAEINLVLTAMLIKANIKAEPVLLSTTDHGKAYEMYPMINKFNYVISKAVINNKDYLLDASLKRMGFNRLSHESYNGYGRVIAAEPYLVPLLADSIKEAKLTTIFINNVPDSKKLACYFNSDLGYFESYDLREHISSSGKDDFFKKIKSSFGYDVTLNNATVDSLENYDERATLRYDFTFEPEGDLVYFNPLLAEAYKSNPFKAATRNYPVEMPYVTDELIVFNMEIPYGYKVEELPRSEKINLNGTDGTFEYLIQADAEAIQLRCRLRMNKANFETEDYRNLREFYAHIVKKQSEQIVFRKK